MATFTASPDNVIRYEYRWNTIISRSESGVEYRRSKQTASDIVWHLMFTAMTKAEADYIIDFFNARRGDYEAFTWVEPIDGASDISRTVRFMQSVLPPIRQAYGVYRTELSFIKVK